MYIAVDYVTSKIYSTLQTLCKLWILKYSRTAFIGLLEKLFQMFSAVSPYVLGCILTWFTNGFPLVNARIKVLDEDIHETLGSSDVALKPLNLTVKPQNTSYILLLETKSSTLQSHTTVSLIATSST